MILAVEKYFGHFVLGFIFTVILLCVKSFSPSFLDMEKD